MQTRDLKPWTLIAALWVLLATPLSLQAAATGQAKQPCTAIGETRTAWYTFDDPDDPGHSIGLNPWPAYAYRVQVGPGKTGSALRMTGESANGLMLPNPAAFFGSKARTGTIALWIQPDFAPAAGGPEHVIFDFMCRAGNTLIDGYEIALVSQGEKLWAQAALSRRMTIPTPLVRGKWTHLALTWDAEIGSALYVDGRQVASTRGSFEPTPLTWWPGRIGSHTPGGAYPFRGWVDELRLFDRQLSPEEVAVVAEQPALAASVKVVEWLAQGVRVVNTGSASVPVRLRLWLAEAPGPVEEEAPTSPGLWGGLPLPQQDLASPRVYIGGPAGRVTTTSCVALQPGDTADLVTRDAEGYYGLARYGLMVMEGLLSYELAGRNLAGLVTEPSPALLYTNQPPRLELAVSNATGVVFVGRLVGLVSSGAEADTSRPALDTQITLKAGEKRTLPMRLAERDLTAGAYTIHLEARKEGVSSFRLQPLVVPVLEPQGYRDFFGVGAAYVSRSPCDNLLARMARDGVKVLRRGPGAWFDEPRELWPHGFKAWYTPVFRADDICVRPELWERTKALATSLGRCLRDKPWVLNQSMLGEGLTRMPCYCEACDSSFRDHLRGRYGDIGRLNATWGSNYRSFADVQQLGSPADVSATAERMALLERSLPEGHAARWRELFAQGRPRAIEWRRWHDAILTQWYSHFAQAFHRANGGKTALSEQPCWPNFRHHVLFSLGKVADLGGMDLYLPGELPTTLGYASELFMNFDLNASVFQDKPLWVHEMYVQDNSPAGLAEAQGWWLVGRGYSMVTYFTYDYYKEGVRANLPLIFGMFDPEGKPYPVYDSFVRFRRNTEAFDRRFGALSLRRERPRVALFLGDDVSLANWIETGGETWNAAAVQGHVGAYWLVERNGQPVEFVNDGCLDRLKGMSVLVVPWTHVVRRDSLAAVLDFARRGGTVILDGPVGLYDDAYRSYTPLPGGAALTALGVRFTDYRDDPTKLILAQGDAPSQAGAPVTLAARGVPVGLEVHGAEVLGHDSAGNPALIHRRLGRGQVYWFLTSLGREQRARRPDPAAVALWRRLLNSAGLKSHRELVVAEPEGPGAADTNLDHGGAGLKVTDPLPDVSLRLKGDRDAFLFLVSFFASSEGQLLLRLPQGNYEAEDAVTREAVSLTPCAEGYRVSFNLPAFGSRVLHVRCTDGMAFADW